MSEAAKRFDLVAKLLRFALDSSAVEGEAINAATRMVQIARRESIEFSALVEYISTTGRETKEDDTPPIELNLEIWFGKFKGKTLGEVAIHSPRYLRWLVEQATNIDPDFHNAVMVVLAWYSEKEGPRHANA